MTVAGDTPDIAVHGAGEPVDLVSSQPPGCAEPDFDDFYRTNYAPAVRLALSLCGRLSTAEEFAQDALLASHQRWPAVRVLDRPDLWLRRVVVNKSLSGLRRTRTERRLIDRMSGMRSATASAPVVPDAQLWAAVRGLPRRQAQAVALRFVEDLTYPEIAEVLACSESTARTHIRRALQSLGDRAKNTEDADDDP